MTSSNGWRALRPGYTLQPGERLRSHSGVYSLVMQGDGNLVAYDGQGVAYWSSYTQGRTGSTLTMQGDGNLVIHEPSGAPAWDARGDRGGGYPLPQPGALLILQDDGNAVVYSADGHALWSLWQSTDSRGSGLGQWIGRTEQAIPGVSNVLHQVAKIVRLAAPAIDAILVTFGGPAGLAIAAQLTAVGAEIVAADEGLSKIADVVQEGRDGFNAAVAVLNDPVSSDQIEMARASLASDEDRAGFDAALAAAPQIADDPAAIDAALATLRQRQAFAASGGLEATQARVRAAADAQQAAIQQSLASGPFGAPAQQPPALKAAPKGLFGAPLKPAPIGILSPQLHAAFGAIPAKPSAAAPTGNQVAILAKAAGLSEADYVAKVKATAPARTALPPPHPAAVPPRPPPPASPRPAPAAPPAPSSSSSGALVPVAIAAAGVALLVLSRR